MNNNQYMFKPMPIGLNPDELHYYAFIISMNRCDGNYLVAEDAHSIHMFKNGTTNHEIIQ